MYTERERENKYTNMITPFKQKMWVYRVSIPVPDLAHQRRAQRFPLLAIPLRYALEAQASEVFSLSLPRGGNKESERARER